MNVQLTARSLSELAPEAQYKMIQCTQQWDLSGYSFSWVLRPREWKRELTNLFTVVAKAREEGNDEVAEACEALLTAFFGTLSQDKLMLAAVCKNLGFGYQAAQ